jgi:multiple sugar transport system ATP-binding protein
MGIRPENVLFVDESNPGAVPVHVEAETPLNEKTVNLCRTVRGREIMASRPSGTPGPATGDAFVTLDASHAVLFDQETGAFIAQEAGDAARGEVA